MAELKLTGVTKLFGTRTALDRVSLDIGDGEFIALLGPSGCGKSTLLRVIAGFERPQAGTVRFGDQVMSSPSVHVPTERRQLGMVFQSYALWPHMSVAENVAFALRVAGQPRAEREERVAGALAAVGLAEFADRRPANLSGGQRQRVALARILAMRPGIVLLDEPLANLDASLRETMQVELRAFHAKSAATTIFVTHDQAEALALADRVAVMMDGVIRQFDTPAALYDRPADAGVARFIGRGSVIPVEVIAFSDGLAEVAIGNGRARLRAPGGTGAGPAAVSLRPEACHVLQPVGAAPAGPAARIRHVRYTGPTQLVTCVLEEGDGTEFLAVAERGLTLEAGAAVTIAIADGWVLPA